MFFDVFRCAPRKSTLANGLSLESYVFNLLYEVGSVAVVICLLSK